MCKSYLGKFCKRYSQWSCAANVWKSILNKYVNFISQTHVSTSWQHTQTHVVRLSLKVSSLAPWDFHSGHVGETSHVVQPQTCPHSLFPTTDLADRLPHTRLTGLGNGDFSPYMVWGSWHKRKGRDFVSPTLHLSWWVNVPSSLMFSPLLFTEMNHQATTQNPRARSKVGFVTLCVRERRCLCVCIRGSQRRECDLW